MLDCLDRERTLVGGVPFLQSGERYLSQYPPKGSHYTLREPEGGFPPVFCVPELFFYCYSEGAKQACERAGLKGLCFNPLAMIIVSAIARPHAQLRWGLRRAVELEVAETMIMARKTAVARIEPLRQEIKELSMLVAEREVSLKAISDKLDQLLIEIRALREMILRLHRGGVPTSFPQ